MQVAGSCLLCSSHAQSVCSADLCREKWVDKKREFRESTRTFYHDIDGIIIFHI